MRILIQRVSEASVAIEQDVHGAIGKGMLILLGIEHEDTQEDVSWLIGKITGLRIFSDAEGKMNLSYNEVGGAFLVISQFTLHASTKKGNRPSYIRAARPEMAVPLYEFFIEQLKDVSGSQVETGIFGADMQVALINDGPVSIWMDSKARE